MLWIQSLNIFRLFKEPLLCKQDLLTELCGVFESSYTFVPTKMALELMDLLFITLPLAGNKRNFPTR